MAPWLLPALFTGGSLIANSIGAGQQSRAIADVLRQNRSRQAALDEESFALAEGARGRYEDIDAQTEGRAGDLGDMYRDVQEQAPTRPMSAAPMSDSNIVMDAEAAKTGEVAANTADERGRLARMRSLGDVMGGIGFDQFRDQQSLGQLGGFKRGWSNVMPLQLEGAQGRGSGFRMLGDLLNMGAGITTQRALIDPASLAALYGGGR